MSTHEINTKRGRGRPRPDYTVDRDIEILSFLTQKGSEGLYDWTVRELASELNLLEKEVYASLLRLSWGNGSRNNPGIPYIYKTSRTTYRSAVYSGIVQETLPTDNQDIANERHIMESEIPDTTTARWQ